MLPRPLLRKPRGMLHDACAAADGDEQCSLCCAGLKAFFTTPQLTVTDKVRNSLALGTSPIVRALIDPEGGMADVRKLDNISFADWFRSHGGNQAAIDRMWDPIGEWVCCHRFQLPLPCSFFCSHSGAQAAITTVGFHLQWLLSHL